MCSIVLLIWGWWAPVWNMVACHVEHFCGKRRLYIQVKGRGAGQIDTCDVGMKTKLELLEKGKQDEGSLTCEGWGKCWPQWAKASVENPRGCQIQRVHNRSTCNASQIKFILLERATLRSFDTVDISISFHAHFACKLECILFSFHLTCCWHFAGKGRTCCSLH